MKYETVKIITTDEIRETVKLHYGVDIDDIRNLMWPTDFMNDCCKFLYYGQDMIDITKSDLEAGYDTDENQERLLVYSVLQDYFPDDDCILVDVSW